MKIMMIILLGICCFLNAQSQETYTVKAKITNPNKYTMYLAFAVGDTYTVDTNYVIENGWAVFRGRVEQPIVAHLGVRGNPALTIKSDRGFIPGPSLDFFLSNDDIEIKGTADEIYMANVTGGKENEEWGKIKRQQDELEKQRWVVLKQNYGKLSTSGDSTLLEKSGEQGEAIAEKNLDLEKSFIKQYPNSLVSMYFLSSIINDLPFDDLRVQYNQLGDVHKNSVYGQAIQEKITSIEATDIGKQAIPIQKKDINGALVNIETLKGKFVLIDFWGSWCGPCRQSHPHLLELYSKYKEHGFEILGIAFEQRASLEDNRRIWKKAIEEDKLTWLQVLNNEGIDEFDAVKTYGVTAFPT